MRLKTKRWNDPAEPDDGFRVLVCRFRPRGVKKGAEPWDEWWPELGPSAALHAAFYGKDGPPLPFDQYVPRYLDEMLAQTFRLRALAGRFASGETLTLLCSSACTNAERCHRSILARLILQTAERGTRQGPAPRGSTPGPVGT